MEAPEELVTAGSKTPSPKTRAAELVKRSTDQSPTVSVQMGSLVSLAYSHASESPFRPSEPRYADSLAADVVPCNMAPRDCLEVHGYALGSADPMTELQGVAFSGRLTCACGLTQ